MIVVVVVLVSAVLRVRVFVCAERSIPKDASACRRAPMVVGIHGG